MALTAQQKARVLGLIINKQDAQTRAGNPGYIYELLFLSAAARKSELLLLIADAKATNTASLGGLDAQKTAAEAALNADNALLDAASAEV